MKKDRRNIKLHPSRLFPQTTNSTAMICLALPCIALHLPCIGMQVQASASKRKIMPESAS